MGASYTAMKGPQTTTEDVPAEEEVIRINHEHAERMDGAFLSIVFSAAIPCGLIIVVTAILLGVIYINKVDTYTGWSELQVGQNGTNKSTGVWAAINSWKKHGGNAALFVDFNPSSLTAVASLTGKIIPYLSSSIMALVAFFVARRIILVSKDSRGHELPTPRQMSLLIQLLGGNSYGPLKDTVHYHIKHKKRWISPIPHAFSALAAVTALGIIIPVADTWFSTTVTPVHVAKVKKVLNNSRSPFGRDFSDPEGYCREDRWWYWDPGNNGWKLPCNMDGFYDNQTLNKPTQWAYAISNANQAALTIANLSDMNTVNDWYDSTSDPVYHYKYLAHTGLNFATDFRAKTVAVKTQCAPMTEQCFQACFSDNPDDEDNCRYLDNSYTFQCSPGFTGELTSNGASLATSLRKNSSVGSTGFGFALDAGLSRMIGNDTSQVEFAAFTNPLYFGTWSLGWQNMPDDDYNDAGGGNPRNKDPWDLDRNIFWDSNYYYAWMLNCSTEISYAYYEWINGTTHSFTPWPAPQEIGGMVSYPFVSGLPLGELCAQSAASHMKEANNSTQLANLFADYFSTCALGIMAGNINPTETILEQTRNNNYGATRVPIVPLFVLLGFKFLYCLAVLCLAVAAYHYTNPAEAQSVKERLTIKGLAATYFCDTPSHQQVAVQNIEQLFRSPEATNAAGDAEAAVPAEQKVGVVQTEMGGWQFVKMTASKVYDAVGPIVEKQLMSDANAGNFGTDGKDVANWVSLVQK